MQLNNRQHLVIQAARSLGQRPFTSREIAQRSPVLTKQQVWTTLHELLMHGTITVVGRKGRLNIYRLSNRLIPKQRRAMARESFAAPDFDQFYGTPDVYAEPVAPPDPLTNTHARALIDKIVDLLAELERELA